MSYVLHDPNPLVHNMLPSHSHALAPPHNAYSSTSCIPHDAHNTFHFMTDDMFLYHASNFFEIYSACTNTPVTIHIMMDDVYVYHTHNLFPFSCSVGPHVSPSTSATHELAVRALERKDEELHHHLHPPLRPWHKKPRFANYTTLPLLWAMLISYLAYPFSCSLRMLDSLLLMYHALVTCSSSRISHMLFPIVILSLSMSIDIFLPNLLWCT